MKTSPPRHLRKGGDASKSLIHIISLHLSTFFSARYYEIWRAGKHRKKGGDGGEVERRAKNCTFNADCPYCSDPVLGGVFYDMNCAGCVDRITS